MASDLERLKQIADGVVRWYARGIGGRSSKSEEVDKDRELGVRVGELMVDNNEL